MTNSTLNIIKYIIQLIVVIFAVMFFVKQCSSDEEPDVVIETTVNIEWIKDSLRSVLVKEIKPIYIDTTITKIKWLKPEKEIVRVTDTFFKPGDSSNINLIRANKYSIELKSNEATADLSITTSGELYDVTGTIEYPKETVTIKETIKETKPHISLYGMSPIGRFSPELGLIYKTKGKLSLMGAAQWNEFTSEAEFKIGAAITIFNKK